MRSRDISAKWAENTAVETAAGYPDDVATDTAEGGYVT